MESLKLFIEILELLQESALIHHNGQSTDQHLQRVAALRARLEKIASELADPAS